MFELLRVKQLPGGLRHVECVLDGKRVEPFIVYPDALKKFPEAAAFQAYLKRQAEMLVRMESERGGNTASAVT